MYRPARMRCTSSVNTADVSARGWGGPNQYPKTPPVGGGRARRGVEADGDAGVSPRSPPANRAPTLIAQGRAERCAGRARKSASTWLRDAVSDERGRCARK